jgi:lipoprotein-anchoring transpeptidase ErfK/SrfK
MWTATRGLFADSVYEVVASTSAAEGVDGTAQTRARFVTATPANTFKVSWEPVEGQTVGVGAPIALSFNARPSDRAAVERRLTVQTDPPVAGSWHWFHDRLVHWRPQEYWVPGTKVHVEANLAGLDVGGGRFGVKDRSMDFVIGPAQISHVDANTHTMEVYSNGALLRTIPVSLGKPTYPTMDGPHNVLGKAELVIMDSATVGIPVGHPEYYREEIQWDVNFTSGGLYVHSAPWSVASQGVANVSHGCINASPENAEWFYNFSRYGDIVDVRNTGRAPDLTQLGNDWAFTWEAWVAGSALPADGEAGLTPIDGTPLAGATPPA